MEYILELNEFNQITIPNEIVSNLQLKPDAHFSAEIEGGQLIIEHVPFSSQEQAKINKHTMETLNNKKHNK